MTRAWMVAAVAWGCGGSSGTTTTTPVTVEECEDSASGAEAAACVTQAFLDSLADSERSTAALELTDSAERTQWSNLPGQTRPGLAFGDLSDAQRSLAYAVAGALLSDEGYEDFVGVLAADDYLDEQGGGGGGPGGYGSDYAHIAVFGTPSAGGDWAVMLGNHHMAYNVTFDAGIGYPVPNHIGVEPKGTFTVGGESYAPLDDDGADMIAVFESLDASQLAQAYLTGQTFGDVVLGPVEYDSGSLSAVDYPTQEGLAVSSLSSAQQDLVTTAMAAWVRSFADGTADALMADYTAAYDQTTIAFGGQSSGPDLDTAGTYMRIDGPRVWIEVAMQSGVILQGTHYHTIYRDKDFDYGASL
ncbi:MAG: DUF3500 domain-containing protein [Myxococcales bacterium]|nr:DUF3500 domain-containing protein [Myxococcales bacterium]